MTINLMCDSLACQTPLDFLLRGELDDGERVGLLYLDPPYHISTNLVKMLGRMVVGSF